jgi:hypothetical protein
LPLPTKTPLKHVVAVAAVFPQFIAFGFLFFLKP